jgi:ADP-ribosylglycohydrolase
VDSILEASTAYLDAASEMRDLITSALDLARRTGEYTRFRAEFYRSMLWQRPQGLGSEHAAPDGYYDIAEPRETIPTVLALVSLAGGRAREAIIYAANFGRDADTIGSMVGGIVGAYQGIDGLPTAWVERVNAVNDVRQDDLARRMLPCITHEIERLEQRLRLLERLRGSASAEALAPVGRSA